MKHTNLTTPTDAALKSLEELEARFSHWRQNKSSTRETIPLDLLQAAKSLSDHLGQTRVKSLLGISGAQLKRGEQAPEPEKRINTAMPATPPSPVAQQQFVKATVNTSPAQAWRIELHSPTGAVVTVSGFRNNPMDIIGQLLEVTHDCA